ncbi:hypothetical protein [Halorussus salinus]|uniref:hypothetical protein n=1 Tax=Halorussus salinus TaxID=1364935 RepID=UPI001091AB44|nr:hypothetical protein [Halorussus salinus]
MSTDDQSRRPTEVPDRREGGAHSRDPLARPREETDVTDGARHEDREAARPPSGGRAGRSGDRRVTRPDDETIDRLLGSLPTVRVSRLFEDRNR